MADVKSAFGTNGQAITISLAGLTNGSSRQSTAIDNSVTKYPSVKVQVSVKTGSSGTTATGTVVVYIYDTANGGTNYAEGASGSDGAITLTSPTNLTFLGIINTPANSTSYTKVFETQGTLADHWGIVITNSTGGTLDNTEGNHLKVFQGLYATVG